MSLVAAADPREVAREILHERRFHRSSLPQPLRRPLHSLGDVFGRLGHLLSDVFHSVDHAIPGGDWVVWLLLAGAVATATVAGVRRFLARGARVGPAAVSGSAAGDGGPSPGELERRAGEAERAGRFEEALRLRFGAGLLSLAQRGVIAPRASLRSGEVAQTLRSADFDALARSFDEVVYGGRPAHEDDAEQARTGWREVLAKERV